MKYYKDGKYFSIEEIENGEKKVDAPKEKKATFIDDEVVHDEHMKAAKSELDKQVDLTIDKITAQLKIKFTDTKIKQRFYTILGSKLREVRNEKEVKYMLSVPKEEGGLGLDSQKADLVLSIVKKHESELSKVKSQITTDAMDKKRPAPNLPMPEVKPDRSAEAVTKNDTNQTQPVPPRPMVEPDVKKESPVKAVKVPSKPVETKTASSVFDVTNLDQLKEKLMASKPVAKPIEAKLEPVSVKPAEIKSDPAPKPDLPPIEQSKVKEEKKPSPRYDFVDDLVGKGKADLGPEELIIKKHDQGEQKAPPMRQSLPVKNKSLEVDSVQNKPYLLGPVEELLTLDLKNFDRIGTSARDSADTLYEKIQTLKAESWRRGLEGVSAWKLSPVFKLYTQMGVASIVSGKSIDQIITDRQIANEETLSPDQFQAILELSQRLDS